MVFLGEQNINSGLKIKNAGIYPPFATNKIGKLQKINQHVNDIGVPLD